MRVDGLLVCCTMGLTCGELGREMLFGQSLSLLFKRFRSDKYRMSFPKILRSRGFEGVKMQIICVLEKTCGQFSIDTDVPWSLS